MEDKEKDVEIDSQGDLSVPAPSGLSLPSPSERHKSEEAIIRIPSHHLTTSTWETHGNPFTEPSPPLDS